MSSVALLMDFLNTAEKRDRRLVHLPLGRFGEAIEVARGALFCMFPSLNSMLESAHVFTIRGSGKRRQQLCYGKLE